MKPQLPHEKIEHYEATIERLQHFIKDRRNFSVIGDRESLPDKDWWQIYNDKLIAKARRKIGLYTYLIRKEEQK